jgi:transposase InsO family protein
MRENFQLSELCEALGISRSGYYAARERPTGARARANQQLVETMKTIHAHRYTRSSGSPRMPRQLRACGQACSKNRVARLMQIHGLRARPRRPFRPKTTTPDHGAHPSPHLLAEAAPPTVPGVQLVNDICQRPPTLPFGRPAAGYLAPLDSYIPIAEGWLYLAVVIDLFSRCVLGWKLSESLHSDLATAAISRALDTGLVTRGAIFHSDRGCQSSAALTRDLLKRAGLLQSMGAKGYCDDNAFAESAFASIEADLFADGHPFPTRRAATTALFDYFETFYNRRRLHRSLADRSPHDFLNDYFKNHH